MPFLSHEMRPLESVGNGESRQAPLEENSEGLPEFSSVWRRLCHSAGHLTTSLPVFED